MKVAKWTWSINWHVFKETGQIPGPNFHFSEKIKIMHITIFFKSSFLWKIAPCLRKHHNKRMKYILKTFILLREKCWKKYLKFEKTCFLFDPKCPKNVRSFGSKIFKKACFLYDPKYPKKMCVLFDVNIPIRRAFFSI